MLNRTSELGIQMLVYLALKGGSDPVAPRQIADILNASPTYLSKVAGTLAKAGILRAARGVKGGVKLAKNPDDTPLIDIVEACQGKILGDYCGKFDDLTLVCGYHKAMHHLNEAIIDVLKMWTLGDIIKFPCQSDSIPKKVICKMDWCKKMTNI